MFLAQIVYKLVWWVLWRNICIHIYEISIHLSWANAHIQLRPACVLSHSFAFEEAWLAWWILTASIHPQRRWSYRRYDSRTQANRAVHHSTDKVIEMRGSLCNCTIKRPLSYYGTIDAKVRLDKYQLNGSTCACILFLLVHQNCSRTFSRTFSASFSVLFVEIYV